MTEPKLEVKNEDGDTTEKMRSRPQNHQRRNNNQYRGVEEHLEVVTLVAISL